jgi:hypothetical protein
LAAVAELEQNFWAGYDAKLSVFFLNSKSYYCEQKIGLLVFRETCVDFAHIRLQNTPSVLKYKMF